MTSETTPANNQQSAEILMYCEGKLVAIDPQKLAEYLRTDTPSTSEQAYGTPETSLVQNAINTLKKYPIQQAEYEDATNLLCSVGKNRKGDFLVGRPDSQAR